MNVPEDQHQQLLSWLEKHGYPFELEVGRAFKSHGWSVDHSSWFGDPESGKPREIDIVARLSASTKLGHERAEWLLAVECKSSKDKPWIVFTTSEPDIGSLLRHSADVLSTCAIQRVPTEVFPSLLYVGPRHGHGIVKAFSEGKSGDPTSAFAALRGVVSAAASIGKHFENVWSERDSDTAFVTVVVPIIVLDGDLFEYTLEDNGNSDLSKIGVAHIFTVTPDGQGRVHVTIMTKHHLTKWIELATEEARLSLQNIVLPQAARILADVVSIRSSRKSST